MSRLRQSPSGFAHRVAIIDDDEQLRNSTARLLRAEGHEVRVADGAASGVPLVRDWKPHLVLLDYYMPGGTGADVVREIRRFDALVQVLLVTGYAAEQPARRLLAELDIQGYHDKGDGPHRMLVQIDGALKHYRALERVDRQRRHMRHILDVSPEICQLQPIEDVFVASLRHVGALLDGADGLIATTNSGLFIMDGARERMSVRAAIGRFEGSETLAGLSEEIVQAIECGMGVEVPHQRDSLVVIPLRCRNGERGCMIVEGGTLHDDAAAEACTLYGRQVVQALENVVLYEKATVDPLTQVHRRSAGLELVEASLRFANRMGVPTGMLLVDLDHFKTVNDTYGHVAGDMVLRRVATVIRKTCRMSDVVFRYGGEELAVALPGTSREQAFVVAERVRAAIEAQEIEFEGQTIRITASIGVAEACPDNPDPMTLLREADGALYDAKNGGRNRLGGASLLPSMGRASGERRA